MKKKSAAKTTSFSCQYQSKPKSKREGYCYYYFLINEQKFETLFSYKIKYFKSSAIDTTLSHKFHNKFRWQVVKGR